MSDTPWASPDGADVPTPGPVPPPPPAGSTPTPPPPPPPPAPSFAAATGGTWAPPPPAPSSPSGWSGGRRIPLRPLRFGEILDASFKLFQLTFTQVAVLVIITMGVATLILSFVQPATPGFFANPEDMAAFEEYFSTTGLIRFGAAMLLSVVTQLFVLPLVRGGVTGISLAADRGGDTSWQAGLQLARNLAGRLLGLAFLTLAIGTVVLIAAVVVIVLPIIGLIAAELTPLAVIWGVLTGLALIVALLLGTALLYLSVPVLVVERVPPLAAIRRSIALVRPQMWRVTGLVLVSGLLIGVATGVFGVFAVLFAFVGGTTAQIGNGIVTTLAYVVSIPFQANIALLLYVDARVRIEALDVAVLSAQLDSA